MKKKLFICIYTKPFLNKHKIKMFTYQPRNNILILFFALFIVLSPNLNAQSNKNSNDSIEQLIELKPGNGMKSSRSKFGAMAPPYISPRKL